MLSRNAQKRIKGFCDRVLSCVLLVVLSPLFLVLAILVKAGDRGPVFFKQDRPGLGGKRFDIWKFRTMIPDADRHLDKNGRVSGDVDRITKVGRFLRSLSLDELPQLINIFRGEMSFIGPRPALIEHLERYTEEQRQRLDMKPGITGLAQVNGRNTLTWSKRIEFDLQYIQDYSLLLDVKILLKTMKVVLFREGIVLDRNPDFADDLGPKNSATPYQRANKGIEGPREGE